MPRGKQPDEPWVVGTLGEVAYFFDVAHQTVKGWRRDGMPGKPKAWNLREIYKWKQGRDEDLHVDTEENQRRRAADADLKELQAERERIRVKRLLEQTVDKATVEECLAKTITLTRTRFERLPHLMASRFPKDCRADLVEQLEQEVRRICEQMHEERPDFIE